MGAPPGAHFQGYDRKIIDLWPLPIARGYRRYRNASEVRERHDAAYYLFEIYLKYAASMAVSRYLALEVRDHRVNAALKGLARPTSGEWLLEAGALPPARGGPAGPRRCGRR